MLSDGLEIPILKPGIAKKQSVKANVPNLLASANNLLRKRVEGQIENDFILVLKQFFAS